jgi:hypothetical protein
MGDTVKVLKEILDLGGLYPLIVILCLFIFALCWALVWMVKLVLAKDLTINDLQEKWRTDKDAVRDILLTKADEHNAAIVAAIKGKRNHNGTDPARPVD